MNAPTWAAPLAIARVDARDETAIAALDRWVCARPDGTAFHRPAWSLAVAEGTRQRVHLLVAHRGGRLAGVLPLTEVHSALFGRALVSSGFAVGGGVLADDAEAASALVEKARSLAERLSLGSIELRGGSTPGERWHARSDSHAGFARDLARSDEAELLAIPRKQRAEVRKSLALPLSVTVGRGDAEARAHYAVYAESVRNLGTPVFPRSLFERVLGRFGEDADILMVHHDGRAVASVLSLYHNGTVLPYWGGGTAEARTLRANDRMYFALMAHARTRGCVRFDFGRSKVGSGAFAFKRNWGFEPQPLTYWHWAADGAEPRDVNPASPRYRMQVALWKRLPLSVANRLGPIIARGLG